MIFEQILALMLEMVEIGVAGKSFYRHVELPFLKRLIVPISRQKVVRENQMS
jgi:hypothetical protein